MADWNTHETMEASTLGEHGGFSVVPPHLTVEFLGNVLPFLTWTALPVRAVNSAWARCKWESAH